MRYDLFTKEELDKRRKLSLWWLLVWFLVGVFSYFMGKAAIGQTPNDVVDDTAYLQQYVDDLCKPSTVDRKPLLSGRYNIKDSIKAGPAMGLRIVGAGGQNRSTNAGWDRIRVGTILKWDGPAGKPMFIAEGCSGLVMEGINFEGDADVGLLISHGSTGCLNIALRNMGFLGMKKVGIQCGIGVGESTSANVTYDNCHFDSMGEACVRIVNEQSLEHLFLRPQFAWSPIAIDVQGGGDISVVGGGTFEMKSFLNLGRIGSNARGFDVQSVRFDGERTRTAWLTAEDTDAGRSYGTVSFANCTMNNGQRSNSRPLVTVPPGCRTVLSRCGFHGSYDNWATVYSDRRMAGELIVEYCDGLSPAGLEQLITLKGNRAYYEFIKCGNLISDSRTVGNFPGTTTPPITPPVEPPVIEPTLQFSQEEVDKIKRILAGELVTEGKLKVQLPEEE